MENYGAAKQIEPFLVLMDNIFSLIFINSVFLDSARKLHIKISILIP